MLAFSRLTLHPPPALLAGLLVSAASALAAQPWGPSPAYVDLLDRYARGERETALAGIAGWNEPALRNELKGLRGWQFVARYYGSAFFQQRAKRLLSAALMLHSDRDDLERRSMAPPPGGSEFCDPLMHATVAEQVALLLRELPEGREFARRWILALSLRAHETLCLEQARRWAQKGTEWFPADAELWLALGTVEEVQAFLTSPASDQAPLPTHHRQRQAVIADRAERTRLLNEARRDLERAVASDPGLSEPHLRLGRVLWRLGRPEAALAPLQTVLDSQQDVMLTYLAFLFRGQIHEDAGRLDEAAVEYRSALHVDPDAQAAAIALSHVSQLSGDRRTTREVLDHALSRARRRTRLDGHWVYLWGHSAEGDDLLAGLRQELTP